MPNDNVLSLNSALVGTKQTIDELIKRVSSLSAGFEGLTKSLQLDSYIKLNTTYTQLTRSIALTNSEAEKLSKTVDLLAKRTQTYSRQELANLMSQLYKSTGTISLFRKEFDTLSERFTKKYKNDADVYLRALDDLMHKIPELATSIKQGSKDINLLGEIMRVSGREGVSAYLAAIDEIPDETENSLNKAELSVKKLKKSWDDARVDIQKNIYEMFSPLLDVSTKFAPLLVSLTSVISLMSTISAMSNAVLVGGAAKSAAAGAANAAAGAASAAASAAAVGGGAANIAPSVVPGGNMSSRLKWGSAAAVTFIGGHAANQALTEEGSLARSAGNVGINSASAGMAALTLSLSVPMVALVAGLAALGTAIYELYAEVERNTEAQKNSEAEQRGHLSEIRTRGALKQERKAYDDAVKEADIAMKSGNYTDTADALYRESQRADDVRKQATILETERLAEVDVAEKIRDGKHAEAERLDKILKGEEKPRKGEDLGSSKKIMDALEEAVIELAAADKNLADITSDATAATAAKTAATDKATLALNNFTKYNEAAIVVANAKITTGEQYSQLAQKHGGAEGLQARGKKLFEEGILDRITLINQEIARLPDTAGGREQKIVLEVKKEQLRIGLALDPSEGDFQDAYSREKRKADQAQASLQRQRSYYGETDDSAKNYIKERADIEAELEQKIIKGREVHLKELEDFHKDLPESQIKNVVGDEIKRVKTEVDKAKARLADVVAQGNIQQLDIDKLAVSYREKFNELVNPLDQEAKISTMIERVDQAEKEATPEFTPDPDKRRQKEKEYEYLKRQMRQFREYGKFQKEKEIEGGQIQTARGAYGATGATTKSDLLGLELEGVEKELEFQKTQDGVSPATIKNLEIKKEALRVQKMITDEIEKGTERNQFEVGVIDKQIERMKLLRAPVGVIAALNREKLEKNKEALVLAEKALVIAEQGKDPLQVQAAKLKVEDAKNAIAGAIDFERRTYAEMFTETKFGRLGQGSYVFPLETSEYSKKGSGYSTGQSGYGQKSGTYQTQVAEMFGAGVDERTSIEKLYSKMVTDGINIKDGSTFKIVGFNADGTITEIIKIASGS